MSAARKSSKAFVLINSELGAEGELVKELKSIEHVSEVYFVYGVYDIVAKVEADSMEEVKKTIFTKIRQHKNVRTTLTMVVVEP